MTVADVNAVRPNAPRWVAWGVLSLCGAAVWWAMVWIAPGLACDPGAPTFCYTANLINRAAPLAALALGGLAVAAPTLLMPVRRRYRLTAVVGVWLLAVAVGLGVAHVTPLGCPADPAQPVYGCTPGASPPVV